MSPVRPFVALVLGAITRDLERDPSHPSLRQRAVPGGVVHYAGLGLRALGATTRVVTRVRSADARALLAPLEEAGVELCALPSRATTTYANDYGGAEDQHELLATSDPLAADDVPPAWRRADVIQVGPLHRRDVLPEVLGGLSGLIGIDLQGLVRLADERGTRLAPNPELKDFLPRVAVAKASEQELEVAREGRSLESFRREFGIGELLVTRGARGALLVTRAGVRDVPAPRVERRFPIGAGDVFLGAYLFARAHACGPLEAARFATRVGAAKVARGAISPELARTLAKRRR
jgi:sugar/nucleoside kinase (ribokinase family)